jgi:hypothetical protein
VRATCVAYITLLLSGMHSHFPVFLSYILSLLLSSFYREEIKAFYTCFVESASEFFPICDRNISSQINSVCWK